LVRDVMKAFERRKISLIQLLEAGGCDAGKQHQVYGAILEIELMLRTLQKHNHDNIATAIKERDGVLRFD